MTSVYLALGSNQGDRLQSLRFAAAQLEIGGVEIQAKSKIYRSASVESGGDGDFLNAVLRVRTSLSASELLAICQNIESLAGREKPAFGGAKREGSRALDVDILTFGDEIVNTPALQLPHPRALGRPFVLLPLLDLLTLDDVVASELDW